MAEYKYTSVAGKIGGLLQKIRETGMPTKAANSEWLATIGLKSSNDRSMLSVLKFVGFMDNSNTPTQLWRDYKRADHRAVLGKALRSSYAELFDFYPKACECSDTDLENFFRPKTNGGAEVVRGLVTTFKALCAQADFEITDDSPESDTQKPGTDATQEQGEGKTSAPSKASSFAPSLHIDVQVHISTESSPEQIEQIFASMAKHLYKPRDE